ncbi:hypothetical protein FB472_0499 [Rhodoglobus vestalii]|uniref:Uncharacterized protein n=1 Tax=Rhodoglobus vestalii TaxID=193384 RepID=A0A8H2PTW5_9MICO|nr:hypothetical protein FB472_0499 [Rhodoglobus vestalii]
MFRVTSEPSLDPVQRRVAVVPIVVAVVAVLVFAIIVTIVVTLAATRQPADSSQPPVVSATPAVPGAATTPPELSAIAPTGASTGTRCIDFTSETDALDIDSVSVTQPDGDKLLIEFLLTSEVPDGSVQLAVYAETADADRSYQFSVEVRDGEIQGATSSEFDRDKSQRMDADDAEIDGAVVRFAVPRSLVKKLDDDWSWFAFTTLDDEPVDACPGDPGSSETLRFDGGADSSDDSGRDD